MKHPIKKICLARIAFVALYLKRQMTGYNTRDSSEASNSLNVEVDLYVHMMQGAIFTGQPLHLTS